MIAPHHMPIINDREYSPSCSILNVPIVDVHYTYLSQEHHKMLGGFRPKS